MLRGAGTEVGAEGTEQVAVFLDRLPCVCFGVCGFKGSGLG